MNSYDTWLTTEPLPADILIANGDGWREEKSKWLPEVDNGECDICKCGIGLDSDIGWLGDFYVVFSRWEDEKLICVDCYGEISEPPADDRCMRCGDELIEKGERDGEGLCHECYCLIRQQ